MATFYIPSGAGYGNGGFDTSNTYIKYRIRVEEGALSGRTRNLICYVEAWKEPKATEATYGTGTCTFASSFTNGNKTASITSSQKISKGTYTTLGTFSGDVTYGDAGYYSFSATSYITHDRFSSDSQSGTVSLTPINAATYTVNYNSNGGQGSMSPSTATYNVGFKTSKNTFTRKGYQFNGWNEKADGTGVSWHLNSDGVYENTTGNYFKWNYSKNITLYAQWKPNELTVNYYSNGADYGTWQGQDLELSNGINKQVHTQAFKYEVLDVSGLSNIQNESYLYLSRTGYNPSSYWGTNANGGKLVHEDVEHSGNSLAEALGVNIDDGNASINVYAQWNPYTHTIIYDANNGTNAPPSQTKSYDQELIISSSIPTRAGYTFVEWNTDKNGTGTSYSPNQSYEHDQDGGSVTLYAIWKHANVAYLKVGDKFVLCNIYIKLNNKWQPCLCYLKVDDAWKQSVN